MTGGCELRLKSRQPSLNFLFSIFPKLLLRLPSNFCCLSVALIAFR